MRIVLFHYYSKKPNPVYQEMAASFRIKGHDVWIAEPSLDGNLLINGVNGTEQTIAGPKPTPAWARRLPLMPKLLWRKEMFSFLMRVRVMLKQLEPDIVQVNPPVMAWVLPVGMPKKMHFVLDIRQINEAVNKNFKTRLRERSVVRSMRLNGRYFYEKTCFCHEQAALRIFGSGWQKKGVVVPVVLMTNLMIFNIQPMDVLPNPIRSFVYIGTLSRCET